MLCNMARLWANYCNMIHCKFQRTGVCNFLLFALPLWTTCICTQIKAHDIPGIILFIDPLTLYQTLLLTACLIFWLSIPNHHNWFIVARINKSWDCNSFFKFNFVLFPMPLWHIDSGIGITIPSEAQICYGNHGGPRLKESRPPNGFF